MHRGEHWIRGLVRHEDGVTTSGVISDDDPVGMPASASVIGERLALRSNRIANLTFGDTFWSQQLNAADTVVDAIESKGYSLHEKGFWNVGHKEQNSPFA